MWARVLFVDDHEQYTSTHDRAEVEFSGSMATRLTILIRLKLLTPPAQQISKSALGSQSQKPGGPRAALACLARALAQVSLRNLHPGTGTGTALLLLTTTTTHLRRRHPSHRPPLHPLSLSAPPADDNDRSQASLLFSPGTARSWSPVWDNSLPQR